MRALIAGICALIFAVPTLGQFVEYNGVYYAYSNNPGANWPDAEAAAGTLTLNGYAGRLAIITSEAENNFVKTLFPPFAEAAWLGGYQADPDAASNATWTWINGAPLTYTNWSQTGSGGTQPDDNGFNFGISESYLAMWGTDSACAGGPLGTWHDFSNADGVGDLSRIDGMIVEMVVPLDPCPVDLDDDGFVDGADLGLFLANWGGTGYTDMNLDGTTDGADLGLFLASWGACPPPAAMPLEARAEEMAVPEDDRSQSDSPEEPAAQ
ncbi:MAG: lectin-like protein [Planctomycetota bacterium]